jgi:DICT domain-containing protein
LLGIVVLSLSILSIWQYGQSLKKHAAQLAVADEQQRRAHEILEESRQQQSRSAVVLDRLEAFLSRVETLLQRLEDRFSA